MASGTASCSIVVDGAERLKEKSEDPPSRDKGWGTRKGNCNRSGSRSRYGKCKSYDYG